MTDITIARIVAGAVIIGFFTVAALMWIKVIPVDMHDIAVSVISILVSKFGTVVDYFFGSSAGSAEKSAALNKLVKP